MAEFKFRNNFESDKGRDLVKEAEVGIKKDTDKIAAEINRLRAFMDQASGKTTDIDEPTKRKPPEVDKDMDHLKEAEESILEDTDKIEAEVRKLRTFLDESKGKTPAEIEEIAKKYRSEENLESEAEEQKNTQQQELLELTDKARLVNKKLADDKQKEDDREAQKIRDQLLRKRDTRNAIDGIEKTEKIAMRIADGDESVPIQREELRNKSNVFGGLDIQLGDTLIHQGRDGSTTEGVFLGISEGKAVIQQENNGPLFRLNEEQFKQAKFKVKS